MGVTTPSSGYRKQLKFMPEHMDHCWTSFIKTDIRQLKKIGSDEFSPTEEHLISLTEKTLSSGTAKRLSNGSTAPCLMTISL